MTIQTVEGNLITDTVQGKIQGHVFHGCNAQGSMGAGIALEVKHKMPQAYEAYMRTHKATGLSMGMTIPVRINEQTVFWNLITQEFYGRKNIKYVSYDAIDEALRGMRETILSRNNPNIPNRLFFPSIGCRLANGKWSIVSSIIETHFPDFDKTLYVLPNTNIPT